MKEFLAILCFLCCANAQVTGPAASCTTSTTCDENGRRALAKGDVETAIELFRLAAGYAEDAQDEKQRAIAYNDLAAAYIHMNDFHRALAWTHVALRVEPDNASAKHELGEIDKNLAGFHWPPIVGGIYAQYAGRGEWSCLCLSRTDSNAVEFQLVAYRMGAAWRSYGPAAIGNVRGKATLNADTEVRYTGDTDFPSCRIQMKFSPGTMNLTQSGDCGFGYGVRAEGAYERITSTEGKACNKEQLP
jgi:hypothetical protein